MELLELCSPIIPSYLGKKIVEIKINCQKEKEEKTEIKIFDLEEIFVILKFRCSAIRLAVLCFPK